LKPAATATPSGCRASTRGIELGLPKYSDIPAKITIARRKLAIGPAATIAARGPTLL